MGIVCSPLKKKFKSLGKCRGFLYLEEKFVIAKMFISLARYSMLLNFFFQSVELCFVCGHEAIRGNIWVNVSPKITRSSTTDGVNYR